MALFRLRTLNNLLWNNLISSRTYAKKPAGGLGGTLKGKGGAMPAFEKTKIPVETDAKKIVEYVCGSNIYTDGTDVKIKPDSEYPDWLWTIRTDKPLPLDQLDPNTLYYWRRVKTINKRRRMEYLKTKRIK